MALRGILTRVLVIGGLSLAVAAFFRFQIVTAGTAGGTVVYRLDRLTGAVSACGPVTAFRLLCSQTEYSQAVNK
jgi:hypothetical protein